MNIILIPSEAPEVNIIYEFLGAVFKPSLFYMNLVTFSLMNSYPYVSEYAPNDPVLFKYYLALSLESGFIYSILS